MARLSIRKCRQAHHGPAGCAATLQFRPTNPLIVPGHDATVSALRLDQSRNAAYPYLSHFLRLVHCVDFATYLSPSDLSRFRVLAGAHHAIHDVASVADLEIVIRTRPIDVVVVDPQVPGRANLAALGTLFAKYPAVPVIAYASVSAEAMHGVLTLAVFGVRHVVLRGYDDQPAAFRATVDRARADTVSASLLERIAAARARLPGPLDAAITILFRAPHTVRGAAALARLAGMPPRTCSRALQRAGLASALLFVRAARVIRAYHYLRGGSDRVADVAARLGYGTPDALARDTRDVTKCRPSALVRTVGPDALVTLVADRLTRRPTRDLDGPLNRPVVMLPRQTGDGGEPESGTTGSASPRAPPGQTTADTSSSSATACNNALAVNGFSRNANPVSSISVRSIGALA
jgi:AraC-like DNA-binding protein